MTDTTPSTERSLDAPALGTGRTARTGSAAAPDGTAPPAPPAPTGFDPQLKRLAFVVILGAIMSILDTTIVNVAIDTLAKDFKAPLSTIQWVSTGYLLALAMVIPLSGWAVERFGAKRVWIGALVVFLAGSALSGAAWSAESLIGFRILQGIGGGMIMPVGQTILAEAAGPQRMGRVMSVLGVPMLLGPVLGPVLGGLIVDSASWRWIFYVNIPIGIVAIIAAWKILPGHERTDKVHHLDTRGLLLLSPGLAFLVYGLSEADQSSALTVIGSMALGVVLMAAFAWHSLRSKITPLIDVRLFRYRSFTAGALVTFFFGAALYGAMLLLPLYYQVVRGESALNAGLLMTPQGIAAALVMPLAGRLTDRLGAGRIVPGGLVLAMLGTLAYTQLGAHTSYVLLAGSLFVRGLGFGFVMMPAFAAAYQNLSREQVPRASTAVNIVQRVGGSVGTALLAVVVQQQINSQLRGTTGGLQAATDVSSAVRVHIAQPLATAFAHTFWWAFGLIALAMIPALFLPRRPPAVSPDPAERDPLYLEA